MNGSGASVKRSILGYLAGWLPLSDLQERIAMAHWNVEMASPEVAKMVYMAVGKLAEYSLGHRSESSLREELANAVRPFVESQAPQYQRAKLKDIVAPIQPTSVSYLHLHLQECA